jgi:hypothetical protein
MSDLAEKLKEIERRIKSDYQGERIFGEMFQDINFLYTQLKDSYTKENIENIINKTIEKYQRNIRDWKESEEFSEIKKQKEIIDNQFIIAVLENIKESIFNHH